jgi:hypothetical protein
VQLADELEATREMAKADWECWKKLEERFERIHGPFLFDLDEDDQDEVRRDKRIRQRWNVDPLQHIKETDMLPYSLSLPPTARVSHTKNSAQRKVRKVRRKRAGKFISCDVGSGEKLIEEEAENACARPHSGIRLSVIDEVDNDSTTEDDDNERNKTDNETANGGKEMSIGGNDGFFVPSPCCNCKGGTIVLIDFRLSSDNVDEDCNNNGSTCGIHGLNKSSKILIEEEEAEDACVVSPRKNSRRIDIGKDEDNNDNDSDNDSNNNNDNDNDKNNNNDNKILLKIQGADLGRYDKYKKRLHLTTAPLWYNCKKCTLKQECIEVGWVSIPSHLLLYTMHLWSCRRVVPDLV